MERNFSCIYRYILFCLLPPFSLSFHLPCYAALRVRAVTAMRLMVEALTVVWRAKMVEGAEGVINKHHHVRGAAASDMQQSPRAG